MGVVTLVAYARTSTADQVAGLEAQIAELRAAGAERCFSEQVSALAVERPQWEACRAWLRDGDVLMVTKPDRLARSVPHLLAIVDELAGKSVGLRILSMNVDTSKPTGKLLLTILGAVAAWEREIMLERQKAGIDAARLAGKYKGRAPTALAKREAALQLKLDGLGPQAIADALGISRASVYRICKADGGADAG